MDERHEIIQFESGNPLKLFMHKLGDVSRHWHESMELLLVLAGEVSITTDDGLTQLKKDDVLLINSNTAHALYAAECVLIAVQIKLSKFQLSQEQIGSLYFDCNSVTAQNKRDFDTIKRLIASMLRFNAAKDEATDFYNYSLAYSFLTELVRNFKVDKPNGKHAAKKHMERLNDIVHYINNHYQEQLTLASLAEQQHLSAPYLSAFFSKYMGMSFMDYYTGIRLEHATHALLHTSDSVEDIALACGFTDTRAFVRAFRRKYDTIPSAYRRSAVFPSRAPAKDPLLAINYLAFQPENYLHLLSEYLPSETVEPLPRRLAMRTCEIGSVALDRPGRPLTHNWRVFTAVGRAKELLLAEVQQMLTQLQQTVGFQYIRFHGIFSDDMMVCCRSRSGQLQFSFTLIDKALDFLLSIGLKPMIQFSFMPAALAADPQRTVYTSPFVISPPRDMALWRQLVEEFLSHISRRYGRAEIRTWLYSVWSEPDTSQYMFGLGEDQVYYELYEQTYRTVKAFDSSLTFGSPSLFPVSEASYQWLERYIEFCRGNGCLPEFVDIHFYSDDFEEIEHDTASFSYPMRLKDDPDYFSKYLSKLQSFLLTQGLDRLPLYITEWNLTVSHRNLLNDTCFMACYVAKNFLENYDRASSFGYWTLTDFIQESQIPEQMYHGGLGLFTCNGVEKPACYVFGLMAKLGDTLLSSGDGYFITKRADGTAAMILYNYEHCNPLFTSEGFGLSPTERYGVFPLSQAVDVSLTLTGLSGTAWRVRETIVNREHGSSFDCWAAMGAEELGAEELIRLREASRPALHIYRTNATDGALVYETSLEPLEVRLVEFTPVEDNER